jgi:hypothetical protein
MDQAMLWAAVFILVLIFPIVYCSTRRRGFLPAPRLGWSQRAAFLVLLGSGVIKGAAAVLALVLPFKFIWGAHPAVFLRRTRPVFAILKRTDRTKRKRSLTTLAWLLGKTSRKGAKTQRKKTKDEYMVAAGRDSWSSHRKTPLRLGAFA